jgi:exopolysaccharide production protein ExoQ
MGALVATVVLAGLIPLLLPFPREGRAKRSAALLLAFAWLWFSSSRNPTDWLQFHGGGKGSADTAYSEGSAFDRNILTGLMLMGVIVLATRSRRTKAFLAANVPVILFFLYCGLSVLWSDHADISIKRWFRCLGDVVMIMVILTDTDPSGAFKWVYTRLGRALVPLSVVFFRWFPALGRSYSVHDGHVTVTGVTDDKNLLGAICTLFALALGSSMLEALRKQGPRNWRLLIGYGCILAMAIYLIQLADSATATACLIEGAGILFLTSMPRVSQRPRLIHSMVAAVLGITAVNLFFGSSLLALFGRNSTLTGRTDLWSLCLTLVTSPLTGAGYESFWLGRRLERMWEYIPGVNQAHNGYLEIYLNLGWVGVILLVALLVTGYRNIIRAVRRQESSGSLRLAFFVVACVANCTEAGFKMMHPMWIALLLVCTARPTMGFVRQRLQEDGGAPEKLPETRDLANSLAGGHAF